MEEDMAARPSDEDHLQQTAHRGTISYTSCKNRDFLLKLFLLSSFFFGILCFSFHIPCFSSEGSEEFSENRGDEAYMAGLFFTIVMSAIVIGLRMIKGTDDQTFKDIVRSIKQIASKTQATIYSSARSMTSPRRQVPAPILAFSTNPTLQKARTPFPTIPAISPSPGAAPDNAIDDALARTPVPTRNNSPLSWL